MQNGVSLVRRHREYNIAGAFRQILLREGAFMKASEDKKRGVCMWRVCGVAAATLMWCGCDRVVEPVRAQSSDSSGEALVNAEPKEKTLASSEPSVPRGDVGVFSDLDASLVLKSPTWLSDEAVIVMCARDAPHAPCFTYIDGTIVGVATPGQGPVVEVTSWRGLDEDGDAIPDQVDLLLGALKTELNGAKYLGGYEQLDYPGGDVSRDKGVCTDVIIRAARNAGVDLQVELFEEIKQSKRSFPMVKKANPHIDQRRVKTLLPYFKRQWRALDPDPRGNDSPYLPGDVVFMQTMGDERPDHVGIVSDRAGESGLPLIINNWTDGFHTSAMDLLAFVPVTHRFRLKRAQPEVSAPHRGLPGVLTRQGIELPENVERVVLVTTSFWSSSRGTLRRYERSKGAWSSVGEPFEVRLGAQGSAVGRGSVEVSSAWARRGGVKKEGDRKSPTGVFTLGEAFGPGKRAPGKSAWPWHAVESGDVWVDDASSPAYNRMMSKSAPVTWSSAEDLGMYELGVVVEHNTAPVKKGGGSAIFLHTFLHTGEGDTFPTLGCTAMERRALEALLAWLDPAHETRLVHAVDEVF